MSALQPLFEDIYRRGLWGAGEDGYYSGAGSRTPEIVAAYTRDIARFVHSHYPGHKPDALDMGCGDFNIGRHIRPFFANYSAVDIAAPLIARNRQHFAHLDVGFYHADITAPRFTDQWGGKGGDIVICRQVLQHLSNADVANALANIKRLGTWLVFSETVIRRPGFPANADIPASRTTRYEVGSALDLERPPFNLAFTEKVEISRVADIGIDADIVTIGYKLA